MKRFLLLIALAAAAAFAIWFGMRGKSLTLASKATVTALLPRETLGFIHVPDFNRTREQWHETDLYKLWREPAVQAFLQRPLTKWPSTTTAREQIQEVDALGMRDAFLAVTAWEDGQPRIAAGFRFKGTADNAEKIIGRWRARLEEGAPTTKSSVVHQQHRIDVATRETVNVASAYDGEWFLAANDLELLKTFLDRVDGRLKDPATTLQTEETYVAASKHLPAGYAVAAYGRVDRYFERLVARLPDGATNPQYAALRTMRSVAAASTFENGRVHDVLFVGRPKADELGKLTRASLNLATTQSFLYLAVLAQLPKQIAVPAPTSAAPAGVPGVFQRIASGFATNGITPEEWASAFGAEASIIGDWPETTRMPALLATVPVKDAAKANKIVATLTQVADEDRAWTTSTKDGAQYYTLPPANPMMPIAPTIAVTNQLVVLGLDPGAVEAALKRGGAATSELATSQTFKTAETRVPEADAFFGYIDTALLYTRLDAALRPMLVMSAAFVPGIADTVDLEKLPAAEIITRHLSPIVISQNYRDDGYVTESVGPLSFYQAFVGIGGVSGAAAALYQQKPGSGAVPFGISPGLPAISPVPPAAPNPSPALDHDTDED